jgi:hypothetical protein
VRSAIVDSDEADRDYNLCNDASVAAVPGIPEPIPSCQDP